MPEIKMTQEQLEEKLQAAYEKGEAEQIKKTPPFQDYKSTTPVIKNDFSLGQLIRAKAADAGAGNSGLQGKGVKTIIDKWNEEKQSSYSEIAKQKAMTIGDFDQGGAMVPEDYSDILINELESKSVIRNGGARVVDMPNGNLTMMRNTAGLTGYWIGETNVITPSNVTTGQEKMSVKKVAAIAVVSNELLEYASPNIDAMLQSKIAYALAKQEDTKFLRGVGTQFSPKGITGWANSSNIFNETGSGTATTATIMADLVNCISNLASNDIPMENPQWIMPPREKYSLYKEVDANGNYIFNEVLSNNSLLGFNVLDTNNIPTNLNANGDETEIYYVDFAELLIGQGRGMQIEVFPNGAYSDGSNTISGISTDQTVIRATLEVDFMMLHDYAASIIEKVDWAVR